MTLDKRNMSRAGGSWLREAKRKGLGRRSSKNGNMAGAWETGLSVVIQTSEK